MEIIKSGLCLFSRVGNNYGVIDLDDGQIDWLTKEDLISCAKEVKINGVDLSSRLLKPVICELAWNKCNWSNGLNIFQDIRSVFKHVKGVKNDVAIEELVIITSDGKKFKLEIRLIKSTSTVIVQAFIYKNICIPLTLQQYQALLEKTV